MLHRRVEEKKKNLLCTLEIPMLSKYIIFYLFSIMARVEGEEEESHFGNIMVFSRRFDCLTLLCKIVIEGG